MKNLQKLPNPGNSISYLYLEHAVIEQNDTAIVAIQKEGRTPIPIAAIACLFLGPGTSVTHAAIRAICENGCMAIWCGKHGERFYSAGVGETRSAKNLLIQAKACVDQERHLETAKRMYQIRFANMNTDGLTLQQLRGMEGIRVRKAYELASKTTGVRWKKRSYKTEGWDRAGGGLLTPVLYPSTKIEHPRRPRNGTSGGVLFLKSMLPQGCRITPILLAACSRLYTAQRRRDPPTVHRQRSRPCQS